MSECRKYIKRLQKHYDCVVSNPDLRSDCGQHMGHSEWGPMPQPRQWRAGLAVTPALLEKAENEARRREAKRSETEKGSGQETKRQTQARRRDHARPKGEKETESPTTPSVSRACLGSRRSRECFVPARSPSPGSSWCSAIAHRGAVQEERPKGKRKRGQKQRERQNEAMRNHCATTTHRC